MQLVVVDDDQDIRQTLRILFEDEGYTVEEADDGTTGLQVLQQQTSPCVVLLDYRMPGLDGGQVLHILADERPLPIKHAFVLITAHDRMLPHPVQETMDRMQVVRVNKPFDIDHLVATVQQLNTSLQADG